MLEMPTADALSRYLSLAAQQMKLTAANMANQTTEGYTRRTVNWSEGDSVNVGSAVSPGVRATVTAQRSAVLQRTVQQATEASSASSARSSALDNLQSLFNIDSSGDDASGIGAAISGFFSAATALGASPTGATARQSLLTAAQTLASAMNATASQLAAQTSSLNQQVNDAVSQVNQLAAQIAELDKQIAQKNVGDNSNALLDQRDELMTQMSKLVDVNTISNSDGSVNLALSNGIALVSGSIALPLSTSNVNGKMQINAAPAAGGGNVTSAVTGGSIGGMLQARDTDIPDVSAQLDAIASAIAAAVNAQNAAGTKANGPLGGDIFSGNTAATLSVTAAGAADIAASSSGSNATAFGALGDATLLNGQTLSNAFAATISGLGSVASAASTSSTANAAILTQANTQLDAESGVSLDTEAANLTQYQRSYEAAAKVLSIVNELMAQAINLGTETTVT